MVEKVTMKTIGNEYSGSLRGYRFDKGKAVDVAIKDAEFMEKNFNVEIVKPEPKPEPKPKTKPKAKVKPESEKKAE